MHKKNTPSSMDEKQMLFVFKREGFQIQSGDFFKIDFGCHHYKRTYIIGIFDYWNGRKSIFGPLFVILDGVVKLFSDESIGCNGTFKKLSIKDINELSGVLLKNGLIYNYKKKEIISAKDKIVLWKATTSSTIQ